MAKNPWEMSEEEIVAASKKKPWEMSETEISAVAVEKPAPPKSLLESLPQVGPSIRAKDSIRSTDRLQNIFEAVSEPIKKIGDDFKKNRETFIRENAALDKLNTPESRAAKVGGVFGMGGMNMASLVGRPFEAALGGVNAYFDDVPRKALSSINLPVIPEGVGRMAGSAIEDLSNISKDNSPSAVDLKNLVRLGTGLLGATTTGVPLKTADRFTTPVIRKAVSAASDAASKAKAGVMDAFSPEVKSYSEKILAKADPAAKEAFDYVLSMVNNERGSIRLPGAKEKRLKDFTKEDLLGLLEEWKGMTSAAPPASKIDESVAEALKEPFPQFRQDVSMNPIKKTARTVGQEPLASSGAPLAEVSGQKPGMGGWGRAIPDRVVNALSEKQAPGNMPYSDVLAAARAAKDNASLQSAWTLSGGKAFEGAFDKLGTQLRNLASAKESLLQKAKDESVDLSNVIKGYRTMVKDMLGGDIVNVPMRDDAGKVIGSEVKIINPENGQRRIVDPKSVESLRDVADLLETLPKNAEGRVLVSPKLADDIKRRMQHMRYAEDGTLTDVAKRILDPTSRAINTEIADVVGDEYRIINSHISEFINLDETLGRAVGKKVRAATEEGDIGIYSNVASSLKRMFASDQAPALTELSNQIVNLTGGEYNPMQAAMYAAAAARSIGDDRALGRIVDIPVMQSMFNKLKTPGSLTDKAVAVALESPRLVGKAASGFKDDADYLEDFWRKAQDRHAGLPEQRPLYGEPNLPNPDNAGDILDPFAKRAGSLEDLPIREGKSGKAPAESGAIERVAFVSKGKPVEGDLLGRTEAEDGSTIYTVLPDGQAEPVMIIERPDEGARVNFLPPRREDVPFPESEFSDELPGPVGQDEVIRSGRPGINRRSESGYMGPKKSGLESRVDMSDPVLQRELDQVDYRRSVMTKAFKVLDDGRGNREGSNWMEARNSGNISKDKRDALTRMAHSLWEKEVERLPAEYVGDMPVEMNADDILDIIRESGSFNDVKAERAAILKKHAARQAGEDIPEADYLRMMDELPPTEPMAPGEMFLTGPKPSRIPTSLRTRALLGGALGGGSGAYSGWEGSEGKSLPERIGSTLTGGLLGSLGGAGAGLSITKSGRDLIARAHGAGNAKTLGMIAFPDSEGRFMRGGLGVAVGKDMMKTAKDADVAILPKDRVTDVSEAIEKAKGIKWLTATVAMNKVRATPKTQGMRYKTDKTTGLVGNDKMQFSNASFPAGRNTTDIGGCGRGEFCRSNDIEKGACYTANGSDSPACYAEAIGRAKGRSIAEGTYNVGLKKESDVYKAIKTEWEESGRDIEAIRARYPEYRVNLYKATKDKPENFSVSVQTLLPGAVIAQRYRNLKGHDLRLGVDTDGSALLSDSDGLDALESKGMRSLTVYSSGYYAPPKPHPISDRAIINVTVSGWHPLPETLARLEWARQARENGWNVILRAVTADPKTFPVDAKIYNRILPIVEDSDFYFMEQPLHVGSLHSKPIMDGGKVPACCVGSKTNRHSCENCGVNEGLGLGFKKYWENRTKMGEMDDVPILPGLPKFRDTQAKWYKEKGLSPDDHAGNVPLDDGRPLSAQDVRRLAGRPEPGDDGYVGPSALKIDLKTAAKLNKTTDGIGSPKNYANIDENYQDVIGIDDEGSEIMSKPYNLVTGVHVEKGERGKGIARKLLEDEISKVKNDLPIRLSADPMDSETDQDKLVKFYESMGFSLEDQTGQSGVVMSLPNKSRLIKKGEASALGIISKLNNKTK